MAEDVFVVLMDAVRATFDAFAGKRISKFERTRLLAAHTDAARSLPMGERTYIAGYIDGRTRAQDKD